MEPEPANGVVVEDVDDVGDQDQDHSGAESFPDMATQSRPFYLVIKFQKPGHRAWDYFHAASHLSFDKQLSRAKKSFQF